MFVGPIPTSERFVLKVEDIICCRYEAAVRNSKILAAFKGDLGAKIAAHKDIPVNYGSEFRDTTALAQLFFHHFEQ